MADWFESCPLTADPDSVLAWNIDKLCVLDPQQAGVPPVPTIIIAPQEPLTIPEARQRGEVVMKPTVSAGAADTGRSTAHAPAARELAAHSPGHGHVPRGDRHPVARATGSVSVQRRYEDLRRSRGRREPMWA